MIRRMKPGDLDRIMEIWLTSNLEAHSIVSPSYWQSNLPAVRDAIAQAEVYLFCHNEEICGFIGLVGNHIAGIFVDSRYRSAGVGRSLLEDAFTRREKLTLEVYVENMRAVSFYRNLGFTVANEGVDPDTGHTELTMNWCRKPA